MNRHYARVVAMQAVYEADFRSDPDIEGIVKRHFSNIGEKGENSDFTRELVEKVFLYHEEIDRQIEKVAPEWPIEQVAIIDRNILRLAICEMLYFETPPKVVINEAIELAKTFGSDNSSKFVNGVLGTVYRSLDKYKDENDEQTAENK